MEFLGEFELKVPEEASADQQTREPTRDSTGATRGGRRDQ